MTEEDALALIERAQGRSRPAATDDRSPRERIDALMDFCDDYGKMIEEGIPEPSFLPTPTLGNDLVYENALSLICGHRKHGKSHVATLLALDAANAHRHVLILDYENGAPRVARRLRDIGADTKILSKYMRGYTFPEDLTDPKNVELMLSDLAQVYPGAVVLVDAFRGYGTKTGGTIIGGFNPNDNTHVERVLAPLGKVAKSANLTVIVIDHPNRMTTGESNYKASNSAAKEQIADAIYWVNKEEPYGVDQRGAISIKPDNDRDGRLPIETIYFKVGGQGHGNPFYIERCKSIDVGTNARIASDIMDLLNAPGAGPMRVSAIRETVTGSSSAVADVLQMLYIAERINKDAKGNYFGGPFKGTSI